MDSHGVLTERAGYTNRVIAGTFFVLLRLTWLSEDFLLQFEALDISGFSFVHVR
jgi:hypothetical protein